MNQRYLWLASALLLGACQTVHDVRYRSAVWETTYPMPFDAMATCLGAGWARDWTVVPQIHQSEQRATVIVGLHSGVIGEYDVRQSSPAGTTVAWRQAYQYPLQSREVADRCAKST
jgi:hypothetical protein